VHQESIKAHCVAESRVVENFLLRELTRFGALDENHYPGLIGQIKEKVG